VDSRAGATDQWKELLASYEDPGIDPGVDGAPQYIRGAKAEIEAE
jgi:hypothetical protein